MKKPTGRSALVLAPFALILALSACGKKDQGADAMPSGKPLAAVPAPAGKSWSDMVKETPEGGIIMGNPDAPVKITEFGSLTCSHCAAFSAEGFPTLRDKYVNSGKVSYELRNYVRDPLDMASALIARCAGPEPFFPLADGLFANQPELFKKAQAIGQDAFKAAMAQAPGERFVTLGGKAGLIDFAMQHGISEDQAKKCLGDATMAEKLAGYVEKANEQYNIEGTPTFLMNGRKLDNVSTWQQLEARLREAGA